MRRFGNRKSVSIAGKAAVSHDYTYDAQGQLTREYDPDKKLYLGYQYDAGGNLTEVCSYPAGAEGGPVFFVKHFSLKKASEFPVFSEGFSLL